MSEEKKDGGPAFPRAGIFPHTLPQDGMSLRDWYAGMALQGMLSNPKGLSEVTVDGKPMTYTKASFYMADAMLQEAGKL